MCIRDRLSVVGLVYAKTQTFDGNTHRTTYLHQFEATAHLNKLTEEEKGLSFILALIGLAAELIQKVI